MEDRKQRLTERITHLIEGMYSRSEPNTLEEWPDIELTMPQVRTLTFLSGGPKRTTEIAEFLGGVLSAATNMIDRLAKRNLVERVSDPNDRRVVICQLTEMGKVSVEELSRVNRLRLERVASTLAEDELEIVARAMEILSTGIDRLAWSEDVEPKAS